MGYMSLLKNVLKVICNKLSIEDYDVSSRLFGLYEKTVEIKIYLLLLDVIFL